MSMLSIQINKLRKLSEEIRGFQRSNSDWLWKDSAKLVDAADMLREAADTIESLRERLQDATFVRVECEMEELERFDGMDPHYRCGACSHENNEDDEPNFCPKCGARVRKAVNRWRCSE